MVSLLLRVFVELDPQPSRARQIMTVAKRIEQRSVLTKDSPMPASGSEPLQRPNFG